jgi:hypothetical protein
MLVLTVLLSVCETSSSLISECKSCWLVLWSGWFEEGVAASDAAFAKLKFTLEAGIAILVVIDVMVITKKQT